MAQWLRQGFVWVVIGPIRYHVRSDTSKILAQSRVLTQDSFVREDLLRYEPL